MRIKVIDVLELRTLTNGSEIVFKNQHKRIFLIRKN